MSQNFECFDVGETYDYYEYTLDADDVCVYEFGYNVNEVNNTVLTGVVGDSSEVEVEVYTRD